MTSPSLIRMAAEIGRVLTTEVTLSGMLHGCTQCLVDHLDASFARIWLYDPADSVLVLHASSGMYTHLDGFHGRVPLGKYKIGMIALDREPHLTNQVVGDPRVSDQEWAARQGMVSFAGYPLVMDDRLIGVVAMFAKHELSEETLLALGSVADEIAVGIERLRTESALKASEERFRAAFDHAAVGMALTDLTGQFILINPAFCQIAGCDEKAVYSQKFLDLIHPDDQEDSCRLNRQLIAGELDNFRIEKRYIRGDGSVVWVHNSVSLVRDSSGNPVNIIHLSEDVTEKHRSETALQQAMDQLNQANQRNANILSAITDAFFALNTDWCFTYVNDQAERLLSKDRAQLIGRSLWDEFPHSVNSSYYENYHQAVRERVPIVFETVYETSGEWYEIRAFPSDEGLAVNVHNITPRKELEAEQERLRLREHNIATQLQDALQPAPPARAPGLVFAQYYEPALAQTEGVGGDFYDVFSVKEGCTALVVGDLSGKGLAAASQVATVRNMLRACVYREETLAEAVTQLNRMLADNDLLTGFTTLFIAAFDSDTRNLRYVNCGQEPALLRRGDNSDVVNLLPTGPILGAINDAKFGEENILLSSGDVVAIFTDGITEAGESRAEMLGIDGVTELIAQPLDADQSPEETAQQIGLRLTNAVDRYASSGMSDDISLLVAVVL